MVSDDWQLPTSIEEARDRVDAAWTTYWVQVSGYTPEQLTVPTDEMGWTISDHVVHVADWEQVVINLIREQKPSFETLGFDEETWRGHAMDWQNEQVRRRHPARSADEVLRFSQETHAEVVRTFAGVSFQELDRPIWEGPDAPELLDYAMGDTEAHYLVHLPWMAAIAEGAAPDQPLARDREALLAWTEGKQAAVLSYLEELPPASWAVPADTAGWTVKDHVSHVSRWDQATLALMKQGTPKYKSLGVPKEIWNTPGAFDSGQVNEIIRQSRIEAQPEEVREELVRTFAEVLETIRNLTAEQLQAAGGESGIVYRGQPLFEALIHFFGDHYREHLLYIKRIVANGE